MKKAEILFWHLFKMELELNSVKVRNIEIGSLLPNLFGEIYLHRANKKLFKSFLVFTKFYTQSIFFNFKNKIPTKFSNCLLIVKTGEKNHLNKLIDPIFDYYEDKSILINSSIKFRATSFFENIYLLGYTTYMALKLSLKIYKLFKVNSFHTSYLKIYFELFFALHTSLTWQGIFTASCINLLIVDHDRQKKNAPIISAAKSLNIKSVTLMHGVLNPPFGYTPLIADEIWVWGELQKDQLIKLGCSTEQIKIVGNPIIEKRISKTYHGINRIGIAVNPVGDLTNRRMWKNMINRLQTEFPDKEIILKLHPSMKNDSRINEIFGNQIVIYDYKNFSIYDFFEKIDVLLTGNSGIAYEAVLNEVPVLVNKEGPESTGNDFVMIEKGKFPDINDNDTLIHTIKQLESSKQQYESILESETTFVRNNIYAEFGRSATQNIIDNIKIKINDHNTIHCKNN